MSKQVITFALIGVIRSKHRGAQDTPIQSYYAKGCKERVEVLPEFEEGLRDLDNFSHVYASYRLHQAESPKLIVKPFLQDVEHGIFSIQAPCSPNAIDLSVLEPLNRKGNVLHLDGVGILDGALQIDIKPNSARFDHIDTSRNGWQDEVDEETAKRLGLRSYTGGGSQ